MAASLLCREVDFIVRMDVKGRKVEKIKITGE